MELAVRLGQNLQGTCALLKSLDFPVPCHQVKDPHKRVLEHQIVFNQQNV